MFSASEAFHKAVYEGNPSERVMLRFSDIRLHAEDLKNAELKLTEALNNEEELTVGSCPSSTLECKILNDHGLLADYNFTQECDALLGIRTSSAPGEGYGPYAILRYGLDNPVVFRGNSKEPWLTVNGEAPTVQPPFPVYAVLIEGNRVYCVSKDGDLWGAAWVDGKTWDALAARTWGSLAADKWDGIQGYLAPLTSVRNWDALAKATWEGLANEGAVWDDFMPLLDIHPFMRAKLAKWAAQSRGVWLNGLTEYEFGETIERFVYVPLGKFTPDQPKKRRVTQISITAHDRMARFDVEAGPFLAAIRYPTTLGAILAGLCAYVGVPLATGSFINSTRLLDDAPMEAEGVTCRELLKWIAEAACSFARMTRSGELELAWFGAEPVNIPMDQYFRIDVAEYQVKPIDKLQVLATQNDIGVVLGSGANGYQILDNPYLYGATDAQIRALAVPIYNRLAAFVAFSPITARAVCDWSIQAGDIIAITLNGVDYRLPIYRQTITWNGGGARVTYESTGSATRPVMSATNRRVWAQKRSIHELTVDVNGLSSRISNAEGGVTSLGVTVNGLTTEVRKKVGNDEIISRINQSAEKITIQAKKIALEGIVTANSRFKILEDGSMETVNGKFSGKITATEGAIGDFKISDGALKSSDVKLSANSLAWQNLNVSLTASTGPGISSVHCNGGLSAFGGFFGSCYGDFYMGDYSKYETYEPNLRVNIDTGKIYRTGYSVSSVRYKKGIAQIGDEWRGLYGISPITYELKDCLTSRRMYGLMAEQVIELLPLLVETSRDNYGNVIPEAVNYDRLPVLMLKALQDINERLTKLEGGLNGAA